MLSSQDVDAVARILPFINRIIHNYLTHIPILDPEWAMTSLQLSTNKKLDVRFHIELVAFFGSLQID